MNELAFWNNEKMLVGSCLILAAAGTVKVTLGGLAAPITVGGSPTPAALTISQYLAALPEVALQRRNVLCTDELCAATAAAAGGQVDAGWLDGFDMASEDPLPFVGQTKPAYGTAIGTANLIIFADALSDEASARCMAVRVAEMVENGAWVLLADGDPASTCRKTFLDELEVGLRYVDCGHPYFDDGCLIEQPSLGWEAEPVALLRLNAPGFAPALNTGYLSLEERRGFELPSPIVECVPSE